MRTLHALVLILASSVACGPGSATPVIPVLPGDGDTHTAKPKDPRVIEPSADDDPWKDRENMIAAPRVADVQPMALPTATRFKLSNGLQVVAIESHRSPVISVQLAVRAGRADASRDKMGIEQLVAQTLATGTRKRSAAAMQTALERAAASLNVQASYENTLISCQARVAAMSACLSIIPDLAANANFPKASFATARTQLAQRAALRHDDPAQLAAMHFQNLLWGDDHVRAWPITARTLQAVTRKDAITWHRRLFNPKNAVLAIAGDFNPATLKATLNRAFRGWRSRGKVRKRKLYKAAKRDRVAARLVDWPGQKNAHVRVGHAGLRHDDPRLFDLAVLNHVLGGDRGSRVVRRMSQATKGRSLGGTSGFDRNFDVGIYVVSAATTANDTLTTVRAILQEMTAMREKPMDAAELARASTLLVGNYMASLETVAQLGNSYLAAELHALRADHVSMYPLQLSSVTAKSAHEVAKKILDPTSPAVVIVGDAQIIGPQLRAIGVPFEVVQRGAPIGRWERVVEPKDPKKASAAAKKILAKALAAKGGAAKLTSVKSMILEGEARGAIHDPKAGKQTFQATVRRTFVAPNKMRRDITRQARGQTAISGIVLDGDHAWAFEKVGAKQGAGDLPPALVQALQTQMWRDQELVLLRYLDKGTVAVALGDRKLNGVAHHAIRLTRADGVSSTLYIDKKTYLLNGQSYSEQGASATERYGEYKSVGGIQVAHRRLTTEGATQFDMRIKKIKFNVTVPAAMFQKPK